MPIIYVHQKFLADFEAVVEGLRPRVLLGFSGVASYLIADHSYVVDKDALKGIMEWEVTRSTVVAPLRISTLAYKVLQRLSAAFRRVPSVHALGSYILREHLDVLRHSSQAYPGLYQSSYRSNPRKVGYQRAIGRTRIYRGLYQCLDDLAKAMDPTTRARDLIYRTLLALSDDDIYTTLSNPELGRFVEGVATWLLDDLEVDDLLEVTVPRDCLAVLENTAARSGIALEDLTSYVLWSELRAMHTEVVMSDELGNNPAVSIPQVLEHLMRGL